MTVNRRRLVCFALALSLLLSLIPTGMGKRPAALAETKRLGTMDYSPPGSSGFSKQYCSGLLFPSPGVLPNPGIEPWSPALQADSLPSELPGKLS